MLARPAVAWVVSPVALAGLGLATGTPSLVGLHAVVYDGQSLLLTLLGAGGAAAALAGVAAANARALRGWRPSRPAA